MVKESSRVNFLSIFQIFSRAKVFRNWLKLKFSENAVFVHYIFRVFMKQVGGRGERAMPLHLCLGSRIGV